MKLLCPLWIHIWHNCTPWTYLHVLAADCALQIGEIFRDQHEIRIKICIKDVWILHRICPYCKIKACVNPLLRRLTVNYLLIARICKAIRSRNLRGVSCCVKVSAPCTGTSVKQCSRLCGSHPGPAANHWDTYSPFTVLLTHAKR